jgi:hypothetical protein
MVAAPLMLGVRPLRHQFEGNIVEVRAHRAAYTNMEINLVFTKPDVWYGGFYELAIELGPHGDNDLILAALSSIWGQPEVLGPFLDNDIEPSLQQRAQLNTEERHLYGVLHLNNSSALCCGSYVVQEDVEPGGSDWILFYVPAQSAHQVLGGSIEEMDIFSEELIPLVKQYCKMAGAIFQRAAYRMALVGFEVSGEAYADTITSKELRGAGRGALLPRNHRLVKEASDGQPLSSGLVWYGPA